MAAAALTTGGTLSRRVTGGRAVTAVKPVALGCASGSLDGTDNEPRGAATDAPEVSAKGNSCRRVGSGPDWKRDWIAGVFMNAPGTGRTGVICGKDIMGDG